jgi:hypothetical protein
MGELPMGVGMPSRQVRGILVVTAKAMHNHGDAVRDLSERE